MGPLESLQHFLVRLQQSAGTLLKIALRSKLLIRLPAPKSPRLIIMGNGPSLKTEIKNHGDLLAEATTLGVNYFANTEAYTTIKPDLYMLSAPDFWVDQVSDRHKRLRDQLLADIISQTDWPMQLFIPVAGVKSAYLKQQMRQFPANIEVISFNPTPVEGLQSVNHFCFKNNWGMPRPHNVIIPSLMLAINIGYREIGLIGVEHSWLPEITVTEDNVALVHQKHFYDSGSSKSRPMHKINRPRRLHEILEKFMLAFQAYHTIEAYAQSRQIQIFNCTAGSYIDAFKRRGIRELLR